MKKLILITLMCSLSLVACDKQDNTLNGPSELQFEKAFTGRTVSYTKTGAGVIVRDSLRIELVGPLSSAPISVMWEVDADKTTAVAGTHYNFISAGTVQIPANKSFAKIEFDVLLDGFPSNASSNTKVLALKLVSSSSKLSPNYSKVSQSLKIK